MMGVIRLAMTMARAMAAQTLRRWAVTAGLWFMALTCLFVGVMGFAAALWAWLAQMLDPVWAGLIIGLGGSVVAVLLIVIAQFRRQAPTPLAGTLADLQAAVKDREADVAVWAPLIGLALLGFVLGVGKKD